MAQNTKTPTPAPARPKAPARLPTPVRLKDVATAAGVSAATVSRVLNNPANVTKELRERVLKASRKLGYIAHGAARALASRRSRVMGAVVPNLSNTIFADGIEGFQQQLEPLGYTMLLAKFDYDEEVEYRSVRTMIERGVDGLMLVGVTHSKALTRLLRASGIPFVQTWAPAADSRHPTIGYDNAQLADLVIDHLAGLGHRDIGIVAGFTRHNDRVRARLAGLGAALARHGLVLDEDRVVHTDYRIADAREAFRDIMGRDQQPTALVANNDVVALGLLLEAQSQGIDVPRDLSIVGVGDLEIVAHLQPALTTIRTPRHAIGNMAADYLLSRINGTDFAIPPKLPLELIVRGTTAPPRRTRCKELPE